MELKKPIYLHIYKGLKLNEKYLHQLRVHVDQQLPELNVVVVKSDAAYQDGQHRVIIGPLSFDEVMAKSRAFKASGYENFPVYFEDDEISLVSAPKIQHKKTDESVGSTHDDKMSLISVSEPQKTDESFAYSDTLESVGSILMQKATSVK